MKKTLMTLAALLVIAGNVEAKTGCAVMAPTKENQYDRLLTTVEVHELSYVLVAKDGNSAREIKIEEINTPEKWRALDGQLIVTFNKSANNQYSLILGKVDAGAENMYSLQAITVGTLQDKGFLMLMAPTSKLALSCYQVPN